MESNSNLLFDNIRFAPRLPLEPTEELRRLPQSDNEGIPSVPRPFALLPAARVCHLLNLTRSDACKGVMCIRLL